MKPWSEMTAEERWINSLPNTELYRMLAKKHPLSWFIKEVLEARRESENRQLRHGR